MQTTSRVKLVDVNPHLMCTLCSGYIIDATTIMECLHSFCKTCIYRYLEFNKLCPICDVQVHKTKPLLNVRPDKTFQGLIYKMVPGLYKDEMERRRDFYSKNPQPGLGVVNIPEEHPAEYQCTSVLSPTETVHEWISLCLELSDKLPPFAKVALNGQRFIQTSEESVRDQRHLLCPGGLTVGHMKRFLRGKFDLFPNMNIDIYHSDEILKDVYTLNEIANIYTWRRVEPLKLYYVVYNKLDSDAVVFDKALKVNNDKVVRDTGSLSKIKVESESKPSCGGGGRTSTNQPKKCTYSDKATCVRQRKTSRKTVPSTTTSSELSKNLKTVSQHPLGSSSSKTAANDSSRDVASLAVEKYTDGEASQNQTNGACNSVTVKITNGNFQEVTNIDTSLPGRNSESSGKIDSKTNDEMDPQMVKGFSESVNANEKDLSSVDKASDSVENHKTSLEKFCNSNVALGNLEVIIDSKTDSKVIQSKTTEHPSEAVDGLTVDTTISASNQLGEKCGFEPQLVTSDVENHDTTKKENRQVKKRTTEVDQLLLDHNATREIRNLYRGLAMTSEKRGRSSSLLRLRLRPGSVSRRRSVMVGANRSNVTSVRGKPCLTKHKLVESNNKK